jgi:hypothetical protein
MESARAHEREGGVQVGAIGITTLGEDGAALAKAFPFHGDLARVL